ncbi:MAG: pyridoxamine 5'-phosphate oxidase [Gemmatimonadaceae bacterium]|jgi:pyridoxamine 5'-phosphate oxidase|nr:pyridoxamine 5'-phosphate oxidase [Gemmatimonadaceae bacterium]
MTIADLRKEYRLAALDEHDVDPDPFVQFRRWFDEARAADVLEPNAMTLATADAERRPSARIVLLKEVDATGFVFYTNYESRKGRELAANARAALCFWWGELERQVRIAGRVEMVDRETSRAYWDSRPLRSRLGAVASAQSREIASRAELERIFAQVEAQYPHEGPPLPAVWGGYRVVPEEIEFWQGRESRLHDRVRYANDTSRWTIARLSP